MWTLKIVLTGWDTDSRAIRLYMTEQMDTRRLLGGNKLPLGTQKANMSDSQIYLLSVQHYSLWGI